MIKNIIFDLAGVVMNLNLQRDTEALIGVGLPDFEGCLAREEIFRPILDYVNGLISADEFLGKIRSQCSADATDQQILYAMDAVLDDIPKQRLERIIAMRKHYRVFLLSNIYDVAWRHAVGEIEKAGYSVVDCFERVFLSYEMSLAKPDPRIFQAVIDATGIVPEETLYYDDSRSNIEAGNKMGFHSVLVPMNQLDDILNS